MLLALIRYQIHVFLFENYITYTVFLQQTSMFCKTLLHQDHIIEFLATRICGATNVCINCRILLIETNTRRWLTSVVWLDLGSISYNMVMEGHGLEWWSGYLLFVVAHTYSKYFDYQSKFLLFAPFLVAKTKCDDSTPPQDQK